MPGPMLTEFVCRVPDLTAEVRFWEEAIGLERVRPKPDDPLDRMAIFDLGGPRLELHAGGRPLLPPNGRADVSGALVLLVDDVEAALRRALDHGARQVMDVVAVPPEGRFVYLLSPANHPVGLVQGDEAAYRARLGMRPRPPY